MLKQYLAELQKNKLLERDEELLLWQNYACGDQDSGSKIIVAYQPLVFKTAIAFKLSENITMELIQEGTIGLLEAAEQFDYKKGVAFSIYAIHRIRGRMLNYLEKEYGKKRMLSLEELSEAGVAWEDNIESGELPLSEIVEQRFITDKVTKAIERLPLKEQQVLSGIYLEDKSANDVANDIEVSVGHIYRLQKQGVRRVRGMLSRFMHELNKS